MSTVLEREVSEGIPVDRAPFEIPQKSRDNEAPRFVTILGSLIEPETAALREWTKWGGIEVANPCLAVVKNFLRKGRISPVLVDKHRWVHVDWWQKATGSDASYFDRVVPAGYQAPMNEFGRPSVIPPMKAKLAYPGEQMESIINGSANVFKGIRRGVVELKSLAGMTYNPVRLSNGVFTDPELWKLQLAIFPKYPFLPILLDETEGILEDAKIHSSLRATVDEMLTSLAQFRDYASGTVEQTHYTMREVGQKSEVGYIPRYTGLDFVLLEQLGLLRQDREIRKDVAAGDSGLNDMFKKFIAIQIEEKEANLARLNRLDEVGKGTLVNGNSMAAAPIAEREGHGITNDAPEGQEAISEAFQDAAPVETNEAEFKCECGAPAKSLAGRKAHQRFCDVAKAQTEN